MDWVKIYHKVPDAPTEDELWRLIYVRFGVEQYTFFGTWEHEVATCEADERTKATLELAFSAPVPWEFLREEYFKHITAISVMLMELHDLDRLKWQ